MTGLPTAAEMRGIERDAIASGQVSGLDLMERAGQGVVDAVLAHWPELAATPHRAIVLCGPGNNGGDGFVVARLLKALGWEIEVFLLGDPARLPQDAATNHALWAALGTVKPLPMAARPELAGGTGLIVDALFGIGLSRGIGPDLAQGALMPFDGAAYHDWHRVAVDVPSGLCADSGRILTDEAGRGPAFRADLTVTFHAAKPGHLLGPGPDLCGRVVVCDIGLPSHAPVGALSLVDAPAASDLRKQGGHKFDHGHALVLSGGRGRSGAARLAARAALRIGAGLVTVAAPPEAMAECAAQLTAVMLREVAGEAELAAMLEDARLTALCLGPGLGLAQARALVPAALAARRATVLDADALTAFADAPDALFEGLHPGVVLTPHDGEFGRLFPDLAARLQAVAVSGPAFSRADAVRAAADRAGCVVLLKGRDTVIADPSGDGRVHAATGPRAVPWLATAGAGDVLAGIITGLMARGLPAIAAAGAAAWLHVEAARRFGPGLIAEDLPERLPHVLRGLGA
ncbi:MAG: NAD(P)H-hydrate dehydratase [Roseicyclus sp.]|nr:NAD(P)H-hydrate dehydratase [Roseicyclus sp.]